MFTEPGVYSFDSYGVFAQDVLDVQEDVAALAEHGAQNITKEPNGLSCDVTIDKDGEYLYFRIPYGKGWTATVNDIPTPLVKANLGFLAIPLDAGTYSVRLQYETPGLLPGIALSCIGLGAFVVLGVVRIRRSKAPAEGELCAGGDDGCIGGGVQEEALR